MLTLIWHPQWASASAPAEPPVAEFSGTPTTGEAPLLVAFTDASTESPTSWLWDFGDSTTSTLQNPSKLYATPGTYTVALTATNGDGSDVETKVDYITVSAPTPPPPPTGGGYRLRRFSRAT
jgi:serine protease